MHPKALSHASPPTPAVKNKTSVRDREVRRITHVTSFLKIFEARSAASNINLICDILRIYLRWCLIMNSPWYDRKKNMNSVYIYDDVKVPVPIHSGSQNKSKHVRYVAFSGTLIGRVIFFICKIIFIYGVLSPNMRLHCRERYISRHNALCVLCSFISFYLKIVISSWLNL
jgi:hypothetical protein